MQCFVAYLLVWFRYLKEAVQAGRQEEASILEKSILECEEELEKLGLGTPRSFDNRNQISNKTVYLKD